MAPVIRFDGLVSSFFSLSCAVLSAVPCSFPSRWGLFSSDSCLATMVAGLVPVALVESWLVDQ